MKNFSSIIKATVICGVLIAMSQAKTFANMPNDSIIAIVNKEIITLKDLHEYLNAIYMQLYSEGKSKEAIEQTIRNYEKDGVNRLIDDKLLIDEANRKEMTIRGKLIDDKIAQIKENYPNDEAFLNALVKDGLTINELKKRMTDQYKVKYIVEMEVKSKIFVNPNEVTEYYQNNLSEFNKPERVDLESIFIPFINSSQATDTKTNLAQNSKDKKAAQKKAADALNLIKGGKGFLEVAKQYSQLPSIGIIAKGQMLPEIESAVFALKDNETSQPLTTETGIFIFKLKSKLPPESAPLEEVKDQVYSMLFTKKFQARLTAWLEELRKKAYVEIKN